MADLRLATIGTSMIADNFVAAAKKTEGVTVARAYSRREDTACAFAEKHGIATWVTSLDELVAAADVDAAYVASPNALHLGQALDLVRAGKHVLVEKPLCANEREAAELFDAAASAGVVAMEAMRTIHNPTMAQIRELVGEVGPLRRATLRYGKYSSRYDELLAGRHTNIFDTCMASGGLLDMGIYAVETMTYLFGRPARVASAVVPLPVDGELTGGALDGIGSALATYLGEDGRPSFVVDLGWSKISRDELPSQIEGEAATIVFDPMNNPRSVHVTWRGTAVRNAGAGAAASVGDQVEELELAYRDDDMAYEVADFARLVAEARETGALPEELGRWQRATLDALHITDEIRRQAGIEFPADAR